MFERSYLPFIIAVEYHHLIVDFRYNCLEINLIDLQSSRSDCDLGYIRFNNLQNSSFFVVKCWIYFMRFDLDDYPWKNPFYFIILILFFKASFRSYIIGLIFQFLMSFLLFFLFGDYLIEQFLVVLEFFRPYLQRLFGHINLHFCLFLQLLCCDKGIPLSAFTPVLKIKLQLIRYYQVLSLLFDFSHLLLKLLGLSFLEKFLPLNSVLQRLLEKLFFFLSQGLYLLLLVLVNKVHCFIDCIRYVAVWGCACNFNVFGLSRAQILTELFQIFPSSMAEFDESFCLLLVLIVHDFKMFRLAGILGFEQLNELALHLLTKFSDQLFRVGFELLYFALMGN